VPIPKFGCNLLEKLFQFSFCSSPGYFLGRFTAHVSILFSLGRSAPQACLYTVGLYGLDLVSTIRTDTRQACCTPRAVLCYRRSVPTSLRTAVRGFVPSETVFSSSLGLDRTRDGVINDKDYRGRKNRGHESGTLNLTRGITAGRRILYQSAVPTAGARTFPFKPPRLTGRAEARVAGNLLHQEDFQWPRTLLPSPHRDPSLGMK
jgi:hypothetical protein